MSVNSSATSSGPRLPDGAQDGSGSFNQDPAPGSDPDRDPHPQTSGEAPRKGRYVYLKPNKSSGLKEVDVQRMQDMQFCDKLCATYKACRSYFRKYLSIMRFHHWGFDKFEQTGGGVIRSKSNGHKSAVYLPIEPPHDIAYDFERVEAVDGGAPVSQVVFCGHYYRCARGCRLPRFVHSCSDRPPPPISRRAGDINDEEMCRPRPVSPAAVFGEGGVLRFVPKRFEQWLPPEGGFEVAYGLTAFELPSFFGFWTYTCLAAAVAAAFWALWLSAMQHPADLQNASIPMIIFVALWVAWLQSFRDKGWNQFEEC